MNAKERLLKELELATAPIPRSTLSVKLGVSDRYLRQKKRRMADMFIIEQQLVWILDGKQVGR